jgi:hypothetical protein
VEELDRLLDAASTDADMRAKIMDWAAAQKGDLEGGSAESTEGDIGPVQQAMKDIWKGGVEAEEVIEDAANDGTPKGLLAKAAKIRERDGMSPDDKFDADPVMSDEHSQELNKLLAEFKGYR